VQSFVQVGTATTTPALVTLAWNVSDPNGDPLTCRLDGDGDGTFELTIEGCQAPGSRNVEIATAGARTATLEVSDGEHDPVTATRPYLVLAGDTEPMDIELRGLEDLSPAVADAFTDAVERWEAAIVRGVPDYTPSSPTPACLPEGSDPLPAVIDDIIIDVSTPVIDGVGSILGQAGPTCVITTTELGIHGVMEFDVADVASMLSSGTLRAVIEHELGHVLGIGTLWDTSWMSTGGSRHLLSGAGGSNPTFKGGAAVAEWSRFGKLGNVPVENSGGPGTRDSHWREVTFGNELMTGYVSLSSNPMSRLSIASLSDLGYRVDLGVADAYSLPGSSALRQVLGPQGVWVRPPLGEG